MLHHCPCIWAYSCEIVRSAVGVRSNGRAAVRFKLCRHLIFFEGAGSNIATTMAAQCLFKGKKVDVVAVAGVGLFPWADQMRVELAQAR